jgi:H+/Cl- antiporter ClcA
VGKGLIFLGLILVIVGLVLVYAPGLLSWFGKLPGDIRVESGRGGLYIPITSMIILSVVLTLLVNLLGRH